MALPLCILVSVGGRRSQRPGPSPTLGSLGLSHQWRHKSRVSLRGPPCAHGVLGTPYGEVRDTPTSTLIKNSRKKIIQVLTSARAHKLNQIYFNKKKNL